MQNNINFMLLRLFFITVLFSAGVVVQCLFPSIAAADWFNTAAVKTNLIDTTYRLVSENLGFIAFAVGGATTFLARGGDMWQKGMAFGAGSVGTAGAIKLAEAMLDLG